MDFTQEQLKVLLNQSFLKADHEFEAPPVCLEIDGEYGKQIFATLGNFSTILARPKVGKTTFTAIAISSLLSTKPELKFIPNLPNERNKVLWIDTEQGKPECVKTIRFVSKLVTGNDKITPDNFIFSSLRQFNYQQRIQITEFAINTLRDVSFVVIDGIRDFVSSINDEREATFIADKLLKWTQEKNIHILTILHQNKGDANARGHLGTELMNKAETVAKLTRDDNSGTRLTIVEPEFTRHKDFDSFSYTIDNDNEISEQQVNKGYQPESPKPHELTHIQKVDILKMLYTNGESYPFGKLQKQIYDICNKNMFDSFGMNKCSDLIKILKEDRFITQKQNSADYVCNTPL